MSLAVPAWDGRLGILRGHAPMITLLGSGELSVRSDDAQSRFRVQGGVLQVSHDQVTILSDDAEAIAVGT